MVTVRSYLRSVDTVYMQYQKHGFGNVNECNSFIIAKIEIVIYVVKLMPADIRIYVNLKL